MNPQTAQQINAPSVGVGTYQENARNEELAALKAIVAIERIQTENIKLKSALRGGISIVTLALYSAVSETDKAQFRGWIKEVEKLV